MSWIESHQTLENHPKIYLLCEKTGWSIDEAIGKLHRLWWWTLYYAEDGDLSKYKLSQFLVRLEDKIAPEELIKAFQEANFIDLDMKIHDWLSYAGRYLHSKYHSSNPKKWKEIRKKNKAYLKSTFKRPLGPNNLTLPNITKPNLTNISPQIENLLGQFSEITQEKIKIYWNRAAQQNKSKLITEGRKLTLITELYNVQERCNNEQLFNYALEAAISHDAINIGYINAVIKNKKTEKPR